MYNALNKQNWILIMAKKNKHKRPIKLDKEMSFEEAMSKIAKAKKKVVDKAIKADSEKKEHEPEEGGENG